MAHKIFFFSHHYSSYFALYFLSVKVHLVSVSNEVPLVILFGVKLTTKVLK